VLLGLRTALLPIFQPRAFLVVLGSCRKPASEFEVPFIEDPVPLRRSVACGGAEGEDQIRHDVCRLPLARRYAGIQMGRSGFKKSLSDIRPDLPSPLYSNSLVTH
jgi:hypothetical protein